MKANMMLHHTFVNDLYFVLQNTTEQNPTEYREKQNPPATGRHMQAAKTMHKPRCGGKHK